MSLFSCLQCWRPGSGRSSGEGNGNPLQYSCLENPMDGGAWWATVPGVTKSWTQLSDFTSFFSVAGSCLTFELHELQCSRLLCLSLSLGVCLNSYPLSQWCHPITSFSVILFSCPQSFPASGSFPIIWLFVSGGQTIEA